MNNDMQELYKASFNRERHGSLFDRGSADSYYRRGHNAHWYPNGSYNDPRVTDLDDDQIAEYNAGYDDNESNGDHKMWE